MDITADVFVYPSLRMGVKTLVVCTGDKVERKCADILGESENLFADLLQFHVHMDVLHYMPFPSLLAREVKYKDYTNVFQPTTGSTQHAPSTNADLVVANLQQVGNSQEIEAAVGRTSFPRNLTHGSRGGFRSLSPANHMQRFVVQDSLRFI